MQTRKKYRLWLIAAIVGLGLAAFGAAAVGTAVGTILLLPIQHTAGQPLPTASNPEIAVYLNRGLTQQQAGQHEQAMASYSRAAAIEPAYCGTWLLRGLAATALQRDAEAKADWRRAARCAPDNAKPLTLLGAAHLLRRQLPEAEAVLGEAIAADASWPYAHWLRALARIELQQYDGAMADLDRTLALNPKLAEAYGSRGRLKVLLAGADLQRPLMALGGLKDYLIMMLMRPGEREIVSLVRLPEREIRAELQTEIGRLLEDWRAQATTADPG